MAQNFFSSQGPKFNTDSFKQGVNLGMFPRPSQESSFSSGSVQDILSQMTAAGIDTKTISPDNVFNYAMMNRLLPSTDPEAAWDLEKKRLDYTAALQEKQAERRQKFGEESTGKAVLYQALANIGPTIAQAMNPGYLMEGASRIARAGTEAFGSVPSMNIQAPGYNVAQFKYF